MADTKISALTAVTGAARSMLIPVVEDPSGTPVTKKMTVDQLLRLDSGTHASSSPLIDMAQTWNAGGTTFTGVKFNIAATAAAADSLLFDFQVGGTSKFKIRHDGLVTATSIAVGDGAVGTPSMYFASETNTGFYRNSTSQISVTLNGAARAKFLATSGGGAIDLLGGASSEYFLSVGTIGSGDLKFVREAAGSFAQRNGTNAQAFRIYNTYTDASNYERGFLRFSGNSLEIGAEGAGTGSTSRSMFFVVGGSQRWQIQGSTGHLFAVTDNTYDIGASGATRPRNVYVAGLAVFGGTVTATSYVASSVYTITSKLRVSSPSDGLVLLQNAGASDFDRLQLGGTTSSFPAIKRDSAGLKFVVADDSASAAVEALSYKSATPSGGTAGVWKLGVKVTSGTSTLNTGEYVELDIGGTLVKLATVTNV